MVKVKPLLPPVSVRPVWGQQEGRGQSQLQPLYLPKSQFIICVLPLHRLCSLYSLGSDEVEETGQGCVSQPSKSQEQAAKVNSLKEKHFYSSGSQFRAFHCIFGPLSVLVDLTVQHGGSGGRESLRNKVRPKASSWTSVI